MLVRVPVHAGILRERHFARNLHGDGGETVGHIRQRQTPRKPATMTAGVVNNLWSFEDLYDNVTAA